MCFGTMYMSRIGSFGSGTELVTTTVRSSVASAVRLPVMATWFCHDSSTERVIV